VSALDAGAPVDCRDDFCSTALMMAAANGHVDVLAKLLGRGADVDAVNSSQNTALHWAALTGKAAAVRVLIEAGCDMCVENLQGKTAVMGAASAGHEDVTVALLASMKELSEKIGDTEREYCDEEGDADREADDEAEMHLTAEGPDVLDEDDEDSAGATFDALDLSGS
jgi:hypothetical protein